MKRDTSGSTLARLSFWVSPERLAEFEGAYEKQLASILKKHGLVESAERGRQTAEGVWSRLFEVGSPLAIPDSERALHQDPAWQEALRSLGASFGATGPNDLLRYRFGIYRTSAGPGKTTEAGLGYRQGLWQMFGVEDGLPSSVVLHMAQDREGNLWLATEGGLCRYDGAEFTSFTAADGLPSSVVLHMAQDQEGNLWFGTGEGVCRYDGEWFETFGIEDGLPHNIGGSILQDRQGNLWFGGRPVIYQGEGLCRCNKAQWRSGPGALADLRFETFATENGNDFVRSVLEDRQGYLWVATGGGLCRYDGAHFETFTTENGLPDNSVLCLLEDREGTLWCGTGAAFGGEGGIARYDRPAVQSSSPARGPGCPCAWVHARRPGRNPVDRDLVGGGWRYDGQSFRAFTTADGLPHDWVHALLEDREGTLWVGTHGGGLCRYDGQRIRNFTAVDGLAHNTLHSMIVDQAGHLWLGTAGGGVSQYDGQRFKTFDTKSGLPHNVVRPVLEDRQGNLWIGTYGGGLCRYDGKEVRTFTADDGLADNAVYSLLEDLKGILWIGTGEGVSQYDGHRFITFTQKDGLPANAVRSLLEDGEGNLWVGTHGGGLCRYDGQGFTTFTTKDGLPANTVMALLEDRAGYLWIGTRGGLCRYDGQGFKSFTEEEGLADDHLRCILEDREGRLWFGTFGAGVSRYDGLVFQNLSRQDGLISNTVNQVCQHPDGTIWITTEAGLTHYRPGKTPPSIRLKDVVADQRYGPVEELQLPVSQRFIRFEFQGRSFTTRPDRMVHVCRLLGREEEWKPCYGRGVEYQDLPMGEYTFQVRAVDRDLNYSEVAEVRLVIVPDPRDHKIDELEQRVRERTRKLEEANSALSDANRELFRTLQEKEKAQEALVRSESMAAIGTLVAGVAHELNNPLGAAYSLVQTVQEMVEEDTAEQLQQEKEEIVGHLAFSRKELNRAKEIVAALLGLSRQNQDYTEAVELNTVVQDALRVLYNQYKKYDLNLVEEYAEGLPSVQGNFAQLGQVCMNLIKNAIEALKGMEGQIALRTYQEDGQVVFECADTGPGMPAEVRQNIFKPFFTTKAPGEGTGLGLYICHQTVEKHRGSIEVESEAGKGTRFRVRLPVQREV